MKRGIVGVLTFAAVMLLAIPLFAQQDGRGTYLVFPQFVDGSDGSGNVYRSTLYIQNLNTGLTNCGFVTDFNVQFSYPDGSFGISSFFQEFLLQTASAWTIVTSTGNQPLQRGYVSLSCSGPVTAQIAYSLYNGSTKIGEATVTPAPSGHQIQLLDNEKEGARLGIAVANDTGVTAQIQILAGDLGGQLVASSVASIPANSSIVGFLDELIPGLPANHVGQVIFVSSQTINVVGLRFTGGVFTTIPATIRIQ